MPSKPPFLKQETTYSCVPACLRMVLSGCGTVKSESDLRTLCDCNVFGTDALKVVDAARHLGFLQTAKHNLSLANLKTLVIRGLYPIVFVNMMPIDGIDESHALVVHEFTSDSIVVLDPAIGERTLDLKPFVEAWAARRNLTIIVAN
jgi:ABC-type bacteriocin/lantibiotic exporter with double-glycine peptidase domain